MHVMHTIFFYLASFLILSYVYSNNVVLHREKRFLLVYPRGNTFKLVVGISMPVTLGFKQSLAYGWNFQFQYALPQNITQLQVYPPIITRSSRQIRSIEDRSILYQTIENILNQEGLKGQECLLESICENAFQQTEHQSNGLYGQLLHLILTPSFEKRGKKLDQQVSIYVEAQEAGKFGVDCRSLYQGCDLNGGILGLFSKVDY